MWRSLKLFLHLSDLWWRQTFCHHWRQLPEIRKTRSQGFSGGEGFNVITGCFLNYLPFLTVPRGSLLSVTQWAMVHTASLSPAPVCMCVCGRERRGETCSKHLHDQRSFKEQTMPLVKKFLILKYTYENEWNSKLSSVPGCLRLYSVGLPRTRRMV